MIKWGGLKDLSNVDLHGYLTMTVWLCGCNLACPFCHNWRLAEWLECTEAEEDYVISRIAEVYKYNKDLIDFIHITGGEPLLSWSFLIKLIEKVPANFSINSNFTIKPTPKLKAIFANPRVNAIATDLKIPFEVLSGMPPNAIAKLIDNYLEWFDFLPELEHLDVIEIRVPVFKGSAEALQKDPLAQEMLNRVADRLKRFDGELTIIAQRLVNNDQIQGRDQKWCSVYCNPQKREVDEVLGILKGAFRRGRFVAYYNEY